MYSREQKFVDQRCHNFFLPSLGILAEIKSARGVRMLDQYSVLSEFEAAELRLNIFFADAVVSKLLLATTCLRLDP